MLNSAVQTVNIALADKVKKHGGLTDSDIKTAISEILKLSMYRDLDENEIFDIVSQQNSSFYEEESKILLNNQNHVEWLNTITDQGWKRRIEWKFWEHYQLHLMEHEKFSHDIIHGPNGINRTVNKILSALDDPTSSGPWDRRGLIVGEVQSGKTANYTALVCKAADAGYKLIIVLAGLYNDLRAQTQQRIDEGFIGFNSKLDQSQNQPQNRIGVGTYQGHPPVIYHTDGSQNGDFNRRDARAISPELNYQEPIILVVKKNKSMMDNVNHWLSRYMQANSIRDVPLMLIDDECDNASVNTRKFEIEDDAHVPTAINEGIRDILRKFQKSVYIGYTATPFANILIKRKDKHKKLGEDLFPRDFILNIPKPSNHIGPEQFFGISENTQANIESSEGYPLLHRVRDGDLLLPNLKNLKKNVIVHELNISLKKAIKSFILSCAARIHRGQKESHNSMLIHITHYVKPQGDLKELVENHLEKDLRNVILNAGPNHPLWNEFKDLWINDFIPVSSEMKNKNLGEINTWEEVKPHIPEVLNRMVIMEVNGNSKDAIEYKKLKENGIYKNFIAIGGSRLARGLTLESLTVSYFLRTSKMYDTLLQMGRWFGYRDGYLDLCRLYTTSGIINAYRHIAMATQELKLEFDRMYELNEKPENWGLKIRSHPDLLLVTGYGKSHWATKASITFDAKMLQSHNTIVNIIDCKYNNKLIHKVILKKYKLKKTANEVAYANYNVSSEDIIEFVNNYKIGPSHKWRPSLVSEYIKNRNTFNELTDWTVGILSAKSPEKHHKSLGLDSQPKVKIKNVEKSIELPLTLRNGEISSSRNYIILDKALLSKDHEKIDLENFNDSIAKGKENAPDKTGVLIREKRSLTRGLLLLYPIYGSTSSENNITTTNDHQVQELYGFNRDKNSINSNNIVFGAVISFSGSSNKENRIDYVFDELAIQGEIWDD